MAKETGRRKGRPRGVAKMPPWSPFNVWSAPKAADVKAAPTADVRAACSKGCGTEGDRGRIGTRLAVVGASLASGRIRPFSWPPSGRCPISRSPGSCHHAWGPAVSEEDLLSGAGRSPGLAGSPSAARSGTRPTALPLVPGGAASAPHGVNSAAPAESGSHSSDTAVLRPSLEPAKPAVFNRGRTRSGPKAHAQTLFLPQAGSRRPPVTREPDRSTMPKDRQHPPPSARRCRQSRRRRCCRRLEHSRRSPRPQSWSRPIVRSKT